MARLHKKQRAPKDTAADPRLPFTSAQAQNKSTNRGSGLNIMASLMRLITRSRQRRKEKRDTQRQAKLAQNDHERQNVHLLNIALKKHSSVNSLTAAEPAKHAKESARQRHIDANRREQTQSIASLRQMLLAEMGALSVLDGDIGDEIGLSRKPTSATIGGRGPMHSLREDGVL